jgi:hypothetical protein
MNTDKKILLIGVTILLLEFTLFMNQRVMKDLQEQCTDLDGRLKLLEGAIQDAAAKKAEEQ